MDVFSMTENETEGWVELLGIAVYNYARRDKTRRKPAGAVFDLYTRDIPGCVERTKLN